MTDIYIKYGTDLETRMRLLKQYFPLSRDYKGRGQELPDDFKEMFTQDLRDYQEGLETYCETKLRPFVEKFGQTLRGLRANLNKTNGGNKNE